MGGGPPRPVGLLATALAGLPEIGRGDDLAALVSAAAPDDLSGRDVVCVAHKAVSKAEGRVRRLSDVEPGERARRFAEEHGKDPRAVQVVLDESIEVLRAERGVIVSRTRHGLVCANAGVDASNAGADGELVLLPEDPDASARRLRAGIDRERGVRPAVLVSDSFGRAWRLGQTDVAVGLAGLAAVDDWRGRHDGRGLSLRATVSAVADAVAGAADLARAKDSAEPVVLVRGLGRFVSEEDGPGAGALVRPVEEDLFR